MKDIRAAPWLSGEKEGGIISRTWEPLVKNVWCIGLESQPPGALREIHSGVKILSGGEKRRRREKILWCERQSKISTKKRKERIDQPI